VRIAAQLIQARDDRHLWSEKYVRDLSDVVTLQGEVAQAVAAQIRVKLTAQEHASLAWTGPVNPRAYEAYLKGTFFRNKLTDESLDKSIAFFTQAIELDPAYAQGYGGRSRLGICLCGRTEPENSEGNVGLREACIKALELDETVSEAHLALADVKKGYDWDWAGAEAEYKRSLELNPSYSLAHGWPRWGGRRKPLPKPCERVSLTRSPLAAPRSPD
jgi:tetratricopeptide (TPR) repeat protein